MPVPTQIVCDPHASLEAIAFHSAFPKPLGTIGSPPDVTAFFGDEPAPYRTDDSIRLKVRDLLRTGGFKPTGRSKPASEYLIKAIEKGWFAADKGINLAVDACNVASLHSGLPISVVDLEQTSGPWHIKTCPTGTNYVFNPTGQVIDIGGLFCLHDADGPCAGPVKDSQRTKTRDETIETLSIVWGTTTLSGLAEKVAGWYRHLLEGHGVTTVTVPVI